MAAHRNVVVTVRGVGEAEPGETLRALAATLPVLPGSYQRADLLLGRDLYPRLVNSASAFPDLIEVDWADPRRRPRGWTGILRPLLGLVMGLPAVRFDWCEAAPVMQTRQAYREVVEATFLWTVWPVLLTLVHAVLAPVARSNALLLEVLLLAVLALLARSQWRSSCRVTAAGYVWLGICLGLALLLWVAPRWTALATGLSIRVYGLAQLVAATAFVAMAVEAVAQIARGLVSRRRGLAGLSLAALPVVLTSLLGTCLWAVVLNVLQAVGSPPVLEALKGWQQTFIRTLGYPLAAVEWAAAGGTVLVAVLALCAWWHGVQTRRGETSRRWLSVILLVIPVGVVLVALLLLLSSPYLGAPLAKQAQRLSATTDVTTIFTWSALRLLPWLVLLTTPVWQVLALLGAMGFYLMPPDEPGLSARAACRERLAQLLQFLDGGDYDHIHVLAHSQGSVIALDVLQRAVLQHPLVLTTLGSPAGTLYRDLLDWPLAGAGTAAWHNLFRQGDPIGGPVGLAGVDALLPGSGHTGYWSDPLLAERVIQALPAPPPAPRT